MGLFDQVLGAVGGQMGGDPAQHGSLVDLAAGVLQGQGGLTGVLDKFRSAGLGQQADSWVSTGQNMPVSPDQVSSVLGHTNVQGMAQKLGLPPGAAAAALATLLPMVIDHLTPNGRVEHGATAADLSSTVAALKSRFLGQA
jgi:uncharacterized protein YidB (DUF937 family)